MFGFRLWNVSCVDASRSMCVTRLLLKCLRRLGSNAIRLCAFVLVVQSVLSLGSIVSPKIVVFILANCWVRCSVTGSILKTF